MCPGRPCRCTASLHSLLASRGWSLGREPGGDSTKERAGKGSPGPGRGMPPPLESWHAGQWLPADISHPRGKTVVT